MSPQVVVPAPASRWGDAEVPPPKISDSAGAEITQFHALRTPGTGAHSTLTFGCVATPIPGWVEEDMRPAVEGRTVALAGASAALAAEHPIDARPDGHGGFELRDVRHLDAAPIGNARTFVGFDARRVHTCFATCIHHGSDVEGCRAAVDAARLEGSSPPPSPGIALAGVHWAVHHPRPFAAASGLLLVTVGILAVVLRRRPRHAGV